MYNGDHSAEVIRKKQSVIKEEISQLGETNRHGDDCVPAGGVWPAARANGSKKECGNSFWLKATSTVSAVGASATLSSK